MPTGEKMQVGHAYSAEAHLRIVQAMRLGATRELAAQSGGVGVRTLRRWMADAKKNADSPFSKLLHDMRAAESASGTHALGCIVKAAKEGKWQAAAWLLERKHGYRRDGVKELQDYAVIPGNLDSHEAEILGEVRRLRQSATQGGSHVAAANLLKMEAEMVQVKRADERAEQARNHATADQTELLSIIRSAAAGMPRAVLDELATIIDERRRVAS